MLLSAGILAAPESHRHQDTHGAWKGPKWIGMMGGALGDPCQRESGACPSPLEAFSVNPP